MQDTDQPDPTGHLMSSTEIIDPDGPTKPVIPDFGEDADQPRPITPEITRNLGALVFHQLRLELEIEDDEAKLDAKKKLLRSYSDNLVPEALREVGLQSMTTAGGIQVTIKRDLQGSLPEDPARRAEAFEYLRKSGNDGLITREMRIALGRESSVYQDAIIEALEIARVVTGTDDTGVPVSFEAVLDHVTIETREAVNHMSMLKFLRDECTDGREPPLKAFGVFPVTKAVIKRPR